MSEPILQDALKFFTDLFENIRTGILFFGGPFDVVLAVIDILITTFVIYYILKIIRDSRAWQLLKGILLIVILAQVFTLIGFQTIGFILSSTLSVLAIAFVVLFQPELRRALETVGRSSFNLLSGMVNPDDNQSRNARYSMIDAIVRAADQMTHSHTGALIVIERETKLGELTEQDNAVLMDCIVSSSMLVQIFYKGSPLHDGAVLIRDGRISAARCHVPLSDNYHLRKDYGTRHRAAIGVSEMGDAIAIAISEERGIISIAISGRIYTLDNSDALRTILHRQLGLKYDRGVIAGIFKNKRSNKSQFKNSDMASSESIESRNVQTIENSISEDKFKDKDDNNSDKPLPLRQKIIDLAGNDIVHSLPKRNKVLMIVSSLLISVFLWLYILITINPVETRVFTVAIKPIGIEELDARGLSATFTVDTVTVNIAGRSKNLKNLSSIDIEAIVDVTEITSPQSLPLLVDVNVKKLSYFEIRDTVPVTIITVIVDKGN